MHNVVDRTSASAPPRPRESAPRVLLLGSHIFPDALEWHIVDGFRALGCTIDFFQTQLAGAGTPRFIRHAIRKGSALFLREPERLMESSLIRKVREFEPTLILATLGNQISPKTIQRLRAASRAAIVCWCQDQMTTIGRQFLLGAEYDAVFVKDRYMQDLFSRMIGSSRFFYLPEACNPRVHRSIALSGEERKTYECEVMIAGTLYYYRQEILRQLQQFDLKIWGLKPDWLMNRLGAAYVGREVFADEKARAVSGAKICLNTLHYGEVDGLNCRAFEIAGCGGFQLITAVPVLAEHFDIGTEIVEFKTAGQLAELIRHFLDEPELAARIALRGQQRAHREHTFEHRLAEILRIALGYQAIAP